MNTKQTELDVFLGLIHGKMTEFLNIQDGDSQCEHYCSDLAFHKSTFDDFMEYLTESDSNMQDLVEQRDTIDDLIKVRKNELADLYTLRPDGGEQNLNDI